MRGDAVVVQVRSSDPDPECQHCRVPEVLHGRWGRAEC
jgi:hypothetical protein